MSLDSALSEARRLIPECLAAGVVDMKTGLLVGVTVDPEHPREILDLMTAATGEIFRGQNVAAIEAMFERARGTFDDDHHFFQEIIVVSDDMLHVFQRSKTNEDLVLVTVCRVTANLGMVLTKSRSQLRLIEAEA